MKLKREPVVLIEVDFSKTADEAISNAGFKYRDYDWMFRNATTEIKGERKFQIATFKLEGGTIEAPLLEFESVCKEEGYEPANLWHLCSLAQQHPEIHRRIIIAPATIVSHENTTYMPTIDGLNKYGDLEKIKTEMMPTGAEDEEFSHTNYKNYEFLAVKEV